jgi:hypothetical protein
MTWLWIGMGAGVQAVPHLSLSSLSSLFKNFFNKDERDERDVRKEQHA